jgi:RNA polymerase sigma-70 factor (ECF subfamily)
MMKLHEEAVFAYCVRMLRDRVLAEDVAQEVFTEAYRDLDRYRGRPSLRAWLIGIARHRCGGAFKARNRHHARIALDPEALVDHVDPAAAPSHRLDHERWAAALEDCLNQLPIDVREAVMLRFLGDMTYDEMAAMLGKEPHTLAVRVGRALPLLRRYLERKGWKPE